MNHKSPREDVDDKCDTDLGPKLGDHIGVNWPQERQVSSWTFSNAQTEFGAVNQDNDDIETFTMYEETWCFTSSGVFTSISAKVLHVKSEERAVLSAMLVQFGCTKLFLHNSQAFGSYLLQIVYMREQQVFSNTIKIESYSHLLMAANFIWTYVFYKGNQDDDGALKLKAWIALHENQDAALLRNRE